MVDSGGEAISILTGLKIYMKSNKSEIVLRFNDIYSNKVIVQVNPDLNWLFHITLENCVGESDKSLSFLLLKLTDVL